MFARKYLFTLMFGMGAALAIGAYAADRLQDRDQTQLQTQTRDSIYGSQLMTAKERSAYSAKMRAAKTWQEREQIRAEHHEQMKVRAQERGVTLPDDPPARGMGYGPGMGPGMGGMGPGMGAGGMGGGGRGR
jgi:hypothetical protein